MSDTDLLNAIVKQQEGGKRQLPEAMKLRVELNKKIAKDTGHEGMWIPIIQTVSWISKKSKETDGVKKIKEAAKYYDSHKDECIKKYKEFNEAYKKSPPKRKGSKKAKRISRGGKRRSSKGTTTRKSSRKSSTKKTSKRRSSRRKSKK